MARVNQTITITAGTPIQITSTYRGANRLFIQMLKGGTGVGYVLSANAGVTPSVASTYLVAQLGAATASTPGGSYSELVAGEVSTIDMSSLWIDGDHSGDTVQVSYNER